MRFSLRMRCVFAVEGYGWHKRWRIAIENPSAIASGTSGTSGGKQIMPVRRSTSTVIFLPRTLIEKISPRFSTRFHSRTPKREKNFMDKCPGWPFMPGIPLTPGLPGVPLTPGTPGTPLTNPSHFPTQIPQSWLPLIRIALSPAISFKVQHFSGLVTWFFVGITSPRMRCAVLMTRPEWSITSAEENSSWAECITRQVNASRLP